MIDVGVIVTRELSNGFFKSLGNCLDKFGNETDKTVSAKFGASTTGTHHDHIKRVICKFVFCRGAHRHLLPIQLMS